MRYHLATYLIAAVWLVNGLVCKVLNWVPRHEQIVGRILGTDYAPLLTKLIGGSEILMAVWVISRLRPRTCATVQIVLVLVMNCLEFVLVPALLLFGRFNSINALLFAGFVYYHAFVAAPDNTPA